MSHLKSRRVVLDLDHTLLHTKWHSVDIVESGTFYECDHEGNYLSISLRPELVPFLKLLSEFSTLFVYTKGSKNYAKIAIGLINKESRAEIIPFNHVVTRNDESDPTRIKSLKIINDVLYRRIKFTEKSNKFFRKNVVRIISQPSEILNHSNTVIFDDRVDMWECVDWNVCRFLPPYMSMNTKIDRVLMYWTFSMFKTINAQHLEGVSFIIPKNLTDNDVNPIFSDTRALFALIQSRGGRVMFDWDQTLKLKNNEFRLWFVEKDEHFHLKATHWSVLLYSIYYYKNWKNLVKNGFENHRRNFCRVFHSQTIGYEISSDDHNWQQFHRCCSIIPKQK